MLRDYLREARLTRGLTQRQLGARLRISGAYVHQVEQGIEVPTALMTARLARAVGLPVVSTLARWHNERLAEAEARLKRECQEARAAA